MKPAKPRLAKLSEPAMKELLPRERFIRALRHEPVDRVPLLYRMKHEAKIKLARIYDQTAVEYTGWASALMVSYDEARRLADKYLQMAMNNPVTIVPSSIAPSA